MHCLFEYIESVFGSRFPILVQKLPIFIPTRLCNQSESSTREPSALGSQSESSITSPDCFVEYIPVKCFNKVVQSAVNARRKGDENPNSSVVAETMNLLANSSYGYKIMDRSRHTVAKYLSDEKTHGVINTKLFKRLDHSNDQLYEIELAKTEIELREPIIVVFFNTLSSESWSFTTTFLRDSVTSTNLRS